MARQAPSPQPASFTAWRDGFRGRALAAGHPSGGVRRRVPRRRRQRRGGAARRPAGRVHQADLGVSRRRRLADPGRDRAGASAGSSPRRWPRSSGTYGVDSDVVLAIWGMESNFGGNRGSIPVIESLATLAYEGRRRDFAEEQLIAALRILQAGDTTPRAHGRLLGRGDGAHPVHPDELSLDRASTSPATAAATSGATTRPTRWPRRPTTSPMPAGSAGAPWGMEVRVPAGFNYGSADQSNRRPVADWAARGVTRLDGSAAARPRPGGDHRPGRGAGAGVRRSTRTSSSSSATTTPPPTRWASATSATASPAAAPFVGAWPRGERELIAHREDRAAGAADRPRLPTGTTDGVIGPDTITAIRAWQSAAGMTPDGFATASVLAAAALMAERPPRLAVLIDADNTSPKVADGLFDEVAKIGEASLRRIYGDFSKGQQAGWEKVLARHAIQPTSSSPTLPARTRPTSRWSSTRWTCCTRAGSTASAWCPRTATSPGSRRGSASRGSTSTASARPRPRRPSARPAPASSSPRISSREPGGPPAAKTALRPIAEATALIEKALERWRRTPRAGSSSARSASGCRTSRPSSTPAPSATASSATSSRRPAGSS